ncbi:MAG: DHH family phosphoesterase, partial [Thermoplasmata archaeon]
SGSMRLLKKHGIKGVVCDHHVPDIYEVSPEARRDIMSFADENDFSGIVSINPHNFGLNGSYEISGAGTTFLVSLNFSERNYDFSKNAIVGAIGDVQNAEAGTLKGMNRIFIDIGKDAGIVNTLKDIKLFGRTSRPLKKFLSIPGDVAIPGITGFDYGSSRFLRSLGIEVKSGETYRVYNDLNEDERKRLLTGIAQRIIIGHPEDLFRIIGETYIFPDEQKNLPTWDASEFATLLNACGRYDEGLTGVMVAGGDRSEYLEKALMLMKNHRRLLQEGYRHIMEKGLKPMKNFDYFYAGKDINENIVGIIANMIISNKNEKTSRPLITIADSDDGSVKVSVRADRTFLSRKIDLAYLLRDAAERFGGVGGGHDLAAGANIPHESMMRFLEYIDEYIDNDQ